MVALLRVPSQSVLLQFFCSSTRARAKSVLTISIIIISDSSLFYTRTERTEGNPMIALPPLLFLSLFFFLLSFSFLRQCCAFLVAVASVLCNSNSEVVVGCWRIISDFFLRLLCTVDE